MSPRWQGIKKRMIVFLLVLSLVSAADTSSNCGFFCKVSKWWSEFRGEESSVIPFRTFFSERDGGEGWERK